AQDGKPLLRARWRWSTIHDEFEQDEANRNKPDTLAWVTMALDTQKKFTRPVLPGYAPIAVQGRVIYRSYHGVHAIALKDLEDSRAGELEWKSDFTASLTKLLKEPNYRQTLAQWQAEHRQKMSPLIYENSAAGTLSADDNRVYAVDDMALPPHPSWMSRWADEDPKDLRYPGDMKSVVTQNTLMSYDLV